MKGHRSGVLATRKIDCGSNLKVFVRYEMHFRHIIGVV